MRQIITEKDVKNARLETTETIGPNKPDDYLDRLLKYIPAEMVALWITAYGIASAASVDIPFEIITWLIFIAILVMTPLYLWRLQNVNSKLQLGLSTVSFAVWVFALGGPFALYGWYNIVYGALLLPFVTVAIPIIKG